MTFYKVWYLGDPKSTHFFVSAEDTQGARELVADHLNQTANFHSPSRFDVGYATEGEANWRTVHKQVSNGFGSRYPVSLSAWEEWKICKDIHIKKVILEYQL